MLSVIVADAPQPAKIIISEYVEPSVIRSQDVDLLLERVLPEVFAHKLDHIEVVVQSVAIERIPFDETGADVMAKGFDAVMFCGENLKFVVVGVGGKVEVGRRGKGTGAVAAHEVIDHFGEKEFQTGLGSLAATACFCHAWWRCRCPAATGRKVMD